MRKLLLLLLLHLTALFVMAQRHETVDPQKDKRQIEGFTVQLRPAPLDTYLYEIIKDNKPLPLRPENPVTQRPEGFQSKEDAYKVATWMISFYKETGHIPSSVPLHVVNELKITEPPIPHQPK